MTKSVVVVEDDLDNQALLLALLERDYDVQAFSSAPLALEVMATSPPDLVLMDISMPTMDGEEALQHIRAQAWGQELPVIAITAHAMPGDKQYFLDLGFTLYLAKPIDIHRLLAYIGNCLAGP